MVDEVWIEIQVDCRQVPVGEQGGDQFLGNLLVASDGHAAMISRPPPRHHWFTDRMTSERTHIFRVVAVLAGLFFVVAVVLMASAPDVAESSAPSTFPTASPGKVRVSLPSRSSIKSCNQLNYRSSG
jgi:hypothetical protein